jgi:hypothetical protein
MRSIVPWLIAYVGSLWCLQAVLGDWRDGAWIRLVCAPQRWIVRSIARIVDWLTLRTPTRRKSRPVGARSSDAPDAPFLAGALNVVVVHLAVFALFAWVSTEIERLRGSSVDAFELPEFPVEADLVTIFAVLVTDLGHQFAELVVASSADPIAYGILAWTGLGAFSALSFRSRAAIHAFIAIGAVAVALYAAEWLGMGFPMLSRGWWAGFSFFPRCWAIFSLHVAVLVATLISIALARFVSWSHDLLASPRSHGSSARAAGSA